MLGSADNYVGKGRLDRLLSRSLQDLIAIWLPYMDFPAVLVIVVCMIYDPTMKLLLYAALPEAYQNWLSFSMLLVEEVRFLLVFLGLAVPAWQLQIIAIQDVHKALQFLVDSAAVER